MSWAVMHVTICGRQPYTGDLDIFSNTNDLAVTIFVDHLELDNELMREFERDSHVLERSSSDNTVIR
jgi:hypothetical protein